MTLVFNKRDELQRKPSFHALIVGINEYPHLLGGRKRILDNPFGLRQLSSGVPTAYAIYEWLLERQKHLPVPLATCRLLLSPSDVKGTGFELNDLCNRATLENFLTAVTEWRDDATSHQDNVTFFYFVGHGFTQNIGETVILLEDFGNGIGPLLRNSVEISNIFYGMAPLKTKDTIARTQFYFIDTSRKQLSSVEEFQFRNTTAVFDINLSMLSQRNAAIYYGAPLGKNAYAPKGKKTCFSVALLRCLNGAAAVLINNKWCVTMDSLNNALPKEIKKVEKELEFFNNLGVEIAANSINSMSNSIIHFLDEPPLVDIVIKIEPHEAIPFTQIEVLDEQVHLVFSLQASLNSHPYHVRLKPGIYAFDTKINPPNPNFVANRKLASVYPPEVELILSMERGI